MNEQRRTRAESTRTHNRSLMDAQNGHPHINRDVKHIKGQVLKSKGMPRDNQIPKEKIVTEREEKEDFKHALKSSDSFATPYADEEQNEQVDDLEKITLEAADFGIQDLPRD